MCFEQQWLLRERSIVIKFEGEREVWTNRPVDQEQVNQLNVGDE